MTVTMTHDCGDGQMTHCVKLECGCWLCRNCQTFLTVPGCHFKDQERDNEIQNNR